MPITDAVSTFQLSNAQARSIWTGRKPYDWTLELGDARWAELALAAGVSADDVASALPERPGHERSGLGTQYYKEVCVRAAHNLRLAAATALPDLSTEIVRNTDLGNAHRLVTAYGSDLRHCAQLGWHHWDGQRWRRDDGTAVMQRSVATVKAMLRSVADVADPDERRDLFKHAMKSESRSALTAMSQLAMSLPPVPCEPSSYDADPWLLNTPSGVLDLRNARLQPLAREHLCTKITACGYDPTAPRPHFEQFIAEVLPDLETRGFVQRFLGYALTGIIRDHVFPVWWGSGRNGKGTLIELVKHVMGDYAVSVDASLLLERQNDAHPTERMQLMGARLVFCSEPSSKRGLSMSTVKKLTGGDTMSGHYMHKDNVMWQPSHKIALLANHKLMISAHDTDIATWSRMRLVPWTQTFDGSTQNTELPELLRQEAAGVLAWLVQGCIDWQLFGLGYPTAVRDATDTYQDETDVVGRWLEDRCQLFPNDAGARENATKLRADFEQWCGTEGLRGAIGVGAWSQRLVKAGAVHPKDESLAGGRSGGTKYWRAICLLNETPAYPQSYHDRRH